MAGPASHQGLYYFCKPFIQTGKGEKTRECLRRMKSALQMIEPSQEVRDRERARTQCLSGTMLFWGCTHRDSPEFWHEFFLSFINSFGRTKLNSVAITLLDVVDDGVVSYFL